MEKQLKGRITDIQRSSIHDGPGIRTTVFFKGCPLNCEWCHNPETISPNISELFYPEKCIGCNRCSEGCYAGARVVCGKDLTVEELLEEIKQDIAYYSNGGGVTFSGGEPLMQREFLSKMIDRCKKEGIHTAVETSLIYFDEEIFSKLDLVMADFKIWDSDLHVRHVGVKNQIIKDNFIKLNNLNVPIIARTPIIPEIEQNVKEISNFLSKLENVIRYELLPYHPLGIEKGKALGVNVKKFTIPTKQKMKELNKYAFVR